VSCVLTGSLCSWFPKIEYCFARIFVASICLFEMHLSSGQVVDRIFLLEMHLHRSTWVGENPMMIFAN
jgi:hypothetical protein